MDGKCSICKTTKVIVKDEDYSTCINGHVQYETVGMDLYFEEKLTQKRVSRKGMKPKVEKKTDQNKKKREKIEKRVPYIEALEIQYLLCYLLDNYPNPELYRNEKDDSNTATFINNICHDNELYYNSLSELYIKGDNGFYLDKNKKDNRRKKESTGKGGMLVSDNRGVYSKDNIIRYHIYKKKRIYTSQRNHKNKIEDSKNLMGLEGKKELLRNRLKVPDVEKGVNSSFLYGRFRYRHTPNYENYERTNKYNYIGNPYNYTPVYHRALEERPSRSQHKTVCSSFPTNKGIKKNHVLESSVKAIYKRFLSMFIKGIHPGDVSYKSRKSRDVLKDGEVILEEHKLRNGVYQVKTNRRIQIHYSDYYPMNIESGIFILYLGMIRCNYNINLELLYKMILRRDLIYYDYLDIFPKDQCSLNPKGILAMRKFSYLPYGFLLERFRKFCSFVGVDDFSKEYKLVLSTRTDAAYKKFLKKRDKEKRRDETNDRIKDRIKDIKKDIKSIRTKSQLVEDRIKDRKTANRINNKIKNDMKMDKLPSLNPSSFILSQAQLDWNMNTLIDALYFGGLRDIIFSVFRRVNRTQSVNGTPHGTDSTSFMFGIIIAVAYSCSVTVNNKLFKLLRGFWIYKSYERSLGNVVDKNRVYEEPSNIFNRSTRIRKGKIKKIIRGIKRDQTMISKVYRKTIRNNKKRRYSSVFPDNLHGSSDKKKTRINKLQRLEEVIEEINELEYIKILKDNRKSALEFYEEVTTLVDYIEKVFGIGMRDLYNGIYEAKQAIVHSYLARENHI
eukprot:GHVP01035936.1.p1 GENE.GHVP01035936.1~~GHVP01035936.1.p1  ORF type:complete len:784 (+),score=129.96 GHVP01035936.1:236-2587(+)